MHKGQEEDPKSARMKNGKNSMNKKGEIMRVSSHYDVEVDNEDYKCWWVNFSIIEVEIQSLHKYDKVLAGFERLKLVILNLKKIKKKVDYNKNKVQGVKCMENIPL